MMLTSVINNVIPIFEAGRKPQETNFGQLPSSVILRLLTITKVKVYIFVFAQNYTNRIQITNTQD